MRRLSVCRPVLAAGLMILALSARLRAQETEHPIDPSAIESEGLPGRRELPLQINGFAVADFREHFASGENTFDASALAVSLFKAFSDRLSFFGQLNVHGPETEPFVESGSEGAVGAHLRRAFRRAEASAGDSNSVETEIDNLQVAWAASPSKGLALVFGKFDSPLAIERDDAPLNFQATPSFVFQFGRPVKFTGIMARETFSPKFEGYAILANGWDVTRDNNRGKTGALYGVWSPWSIAHFGLGVIHGAEKDDTSGDRRTTAVATILVQQTASWVWGEEFVYGTEPHSSEDGGTARWFGDMFFTHHRLGRHWAITFRADYFDDVDGSRTGHRQVVRSFTVSPQYLVGGGFFGQYRYLERTALRIPELALRLDLRFDRSTEPVFAGGGETVRRDSPSAALQAVYVF